MQARTQHQQRREITQLTTVTPEYQYHLKDHLGNVRVTFTTKDETLNYTATFENNTQTTEQATFRNYTRVTNDLYDHTDAGTTYDKVQLLNGGNNSQVGITKSIAVMPGDVVSASVWAKYFGATGGSGNLTGFASALLSAFGLTAPAGGEAGTASAAIQSYGSFIAGGGNTGNSGWPKGWLNMLIFDNNYNLVDLAYQQLDATYVQPVGNGTKMPMQQLSLSKTIKEPGYVYIYISNEGSVQQDIYFDDMNITHAKSKIIQADDYYPFGLTFNSYQRENSVINDFLYSGKEQQDELGLNWIDFGARMYMADIGRWGVVDPLTEKAMGWTPYRYAFNNPLLFVDPTGMEEEKKTQETYVKGGYGESISTSNVAAHSGAMYNSKGKEVRSYSFISNRTGKTIGSGNFTEDQINDWRDSQDKVNTDRMETIGKLESTRRAQQRVPGITVLNFGPETTDPDNLGVNIRLGYNDPKKRFSEYRWIQTVRTNALNSYAMSSPFNDSPGNGTPYYWEDDEMGTWTNVDGFSAMFFDSPGRAKNSESVFWRAELTIGGMKEGVFVPLGTMTYGFDINNGKLTIVPLQVAEPTPWHLDSFTNKSKW